MNHGSPANQPLIESRNVGDFPRYSFIRPPAASEFFQPPLMVLSAGNAHWVAGCLRRRKSLAYSINLVCAGNMEFTQDGVHHVVQPGQAYFLRRGCQIGLTPGKAGFCLTRAMRLHGPMMDSLVRWLGIEEKDILVPRDVDVMKGLYKLAHRLLKETPPGYVTRLSAIAYQILQEYAILVGRERYCRETERALEVIQSRLSARLSRSELCAECGASPANLTRLFKRDIGLPPVAYYLREKMRLAAVMLRSERRSVKEISASLGFADPLYFSAQFKKHLGMPPNRYRKAHPGEEAV